MRKIKFTEGEYYHLYNRGVDRRTIFGSKEDYDRFEAYLYLLNDTESPRAANFFQGSRSEQVFSSGRTDQLVAIGAYSIVQDRFHILATPLVENGVSRFMHKIQTAYTMYFNDKYARDGRLLQGTFKARHVTKGAHLKYIFSFIHLDASTLFDQNWSSKSDEVIESSAKKIMQYRYSSAGEYLTSKHVITTPRKYPRHLAESSDTRAFIEPWQKHKSRFYVEEWR